MTEMKIGSCFDRVPWKESVAKVVAIKKGSSGMMKEVTIFKVICWNSFNNS